MKKRGISPLIATVLIIGFTIVLASLVMTWGGDLFKKTTEETGETALKQLTLMQEAGMDIENVEIDSLQKIIKLTISNPKQTKISGVIIKVEGGGQSESIREDIEINKYEAKPIEVTYTLNTIDNLKVIPIFEIDGQQAISIGQEETIHSSDFNIYEYVLEECTDFTNTATIIDCCQLQAVKDNLAGSYTLGGNIYCSFSNTWNDGAGFEPIPSFTGHFDGQGFTITDLFINRYINDIGLFSSTSAGSEIKNIGLINCNIVGGDQYVGCLVGTNYGAISNSYSTGSSSGRHYVGGLIGRSKTGGSITKSYSTASVSGGLYTGGLVGRSGGSIVINSYATGSVAGSVSHVGGLIGQMTTDSITTNCYSTGTSTSGGLIGSIQGTGPPTNSFWDTETSEKETSAGGTGKTTVQMQNPATFATWDSNIWNLEEGSYPTLK